MDDFVVVLNAGSSSLKFCTYSRQEGGAWQLAGRGQIEGIGTSPRFSARDDAGSSLAREALDSKAVWDGRTALDALAAWLKSRYGGARVLGVGHRVVHGGPKLVEPVVIDDAVLAEIEAMSSVAPLHNAPALEAIAEARTALPDVPQVAVFDTAFHATLPEQARTYAVPADWREKLTARERIQSALAPLSARLTASS